MKKTIRTFAVTLTFLLLILSLAGCCIPSSDMPFNGEMTFHDLQLCIPDSFIRDSTQSTEDLWAFEKGFYKQIILLSRNPLNPDKTESEALDDYLALMQERGAQASMDEFLGCGAVHSTYTLDGKFCQEMLFYYNGYFYAVALRGGTEQEFADLLATVTLLKSSAEM